MRYLSILTFLFSIALINPTHAGVLIELDLSVTNQLTLTATTGTALASVTGTTGTGIVLDGTGQLTVTYVGDASDTFGVKSTGAFTNTPELFPILNDSGVYSINLYEGNDGTETSINEGQQAFVGTTTITLGATEYANLLNAPNSGKIYAFDDTPNYQSSTYIGDWAKASSGTVPEPSTAIAMGLLGVLGFAGNRRRRLGVANA